MSSVYLRAWFAYGGEEMFYGGMSYCTIYRKTPYLTVGCREVFRPSAYKVKAFSCEVVWVKSLVKSVGEVVR